MTAAGQFVWEAPGQSHRVFLDLDVVDRLLREVMRGLGAVPRRGVETGGILLGYVGEDGSVCIEDFEMVPCRHTRGPAYLLAGDEATRFEEAVAKWQPEAGRRTYAVGYFRSHLREGLQTTAEDAALFERNFPNSADVALLVKPFATRASIGGFFPRQGGMLAAECDQQFPFRRDELSGDPGHRSLPDAENSESVSDMNATESLTGELHRSERQRFGIPGVRTEATPDGGKKRFRNGWAWMPLSFIFLLLGVAVGIHVTVSVVTLPKSIRPADPYALDLSVTQSGDSLHVRWDRLAPVVQSATRGTLVINDSGNEKAVELDAPQLQNGSVIYRRASDSVRFRLEVQTRDRNTVTETREFHQETK